MKSTLLSLLVIFSISITTAQEDKPRFGQTVRSPQVGADGRIIFRFKAPGAQNVFVLFEGEKPLPMVKDDKGVWSLTTETRPPDLYVYRFVVDGTSLADPANPGLKPIITGGAESVVLVPGSKAQPWEEQKVSHGLLHRHRYESKAVGETRDFLVYTPPGYDPSRKQGYPVLYLLHGVMEDASAWTAAGRADAILDNLIAEGKAKPMLLVMPLGYGFPNAADRVAEQFGGFTQQMKFLETLSATLLGEIIPEVERRYRVDARREARAISGVSLGGAQALFLGLNNPDRFGWLGSFSGAFSIFGNQYQKVFPGSKAPPKLLQISCGQGDFLAPVNRQFGEFLTSTGVSFAKVETQGGHTWQVWRRDLVAFATKLFR